VERENLSGALDDILKEKIDLVCQGHTGEHELAKIAADYSPIDLAYAAPRLPPAIRPALYENLADIDRKISFIISADNTTRTAVFRHMHDEEAKKLIEKMPPDDVVAVLEVVSERRFRRLLEMIDPQKAARIREIKQHMRNTAGRLMTNEFFAFPATITIGEASRMIRENPGVDLKGQVFVLDAEGKLQGYVSERTLIVSSDQLPLQFVMKPVLRKVHTDASREEVVDMVERYRLLTLPVIDSEDRLLGLVTCEDVMEAMGDMADEIISQMAGTGEKVGEHEPTWKRCLARAPWLVVTLCAGFLNMGVMSSIQGYEGGIMTFALFFVPLITGLSGNIGIQCSTVLVRSMATGVLTPGSRGEAIGKEVTIGVFSGLMFGCLAGLLVWSLDFACSSAPCHVGLIVGAGLCGACLTSTLLGVFSPLFFVRIGVDPAIASGPIITAISDFLSMSIYFLIAIGINVLMY